MPRPRGHVEKRGDGRYRIWVPLGTGPDGEYEWHREPFRGSPEDAQRRLTELLYQYDTNRITSADGLTYAQYLDRWLADAIKPPKQEQGTYDANKSVIENHIKPGLGHIPLGKLQLLHIERFYSALFEPGARKDGRTGPDGEPLPLGLETVRRIHATVRWSLADAVRWHLIPFNAAAEAKLPAKEKKPKPTWKPAQLERYLQHIRRSPYRAFILVLAFTGCRIGEACGLKWDEDIDFDDDLILFDEALKKPGEKPVLGSTKKDKVREVPMHPVLRSALLEHRQFQEELADFFGTEWNRWGFVFTTQSPKGTPVDQNRFRNRVWYKIQDELNAELKKEGKQPLRRLTPHGLRHTFATILLGKKEDPKKIAELLGHADVAFMLREYDHPDEGGRRSAVESLVSTGERESNGSEARSTPANRTQRRTGRSRLQRTSRNRISRN